MNLSMILKKIIPLHLLLFLSVVSGTTVAQVKPGGTRSSATAVKVPVAYTSPSLNYIRSWTPSMPLTDTAAVASSARKPREVTQNTRYFDGLGRPLQDVVKAITPTGRDMVKPYIYDAFGRESRKYLPYAQQSGNTSDGKFKNSPFTAQKEFYENSILNPDIANEHIYYDSIQYDAVPDDYVLRSFGPGDSWVNHPKEIQYLSNITTDSVRIWTPGNNVPVTSNIYAASQLSKIVSIDEQSNRTVEYRDKEERLILRKVQLAEFPGNAHVGWLCTYYVYDEYSNVRFVIPPMATDVTMRNGWNIPVGTTDELCYQYQYDDRQRMVTKKMPGAGKLFMVYDLRDRLAFSQDSLQRAKSPMEWYAMFYDEINRPVMTAIYTASSTREALQSAMDGTSAGKVLTTLSPVMADRVLYSHDGSSVYTATNSIEAVDNFEINGGEVVLTIDPGAKDTFVINASLVLPTLSTSALTPLLYSYYDNYEYSGKHAFFPGDFSKLQAADTLFPEYTGATYSNNVQGLVTGVRVRILGTDQWTTSTAYYDSKGRMVQTIGDNNQGGKDIESVLFNFNGDILTAYLRHMDPSGNTPLLTTLSTYGYNQTGNVTIVKKRLNDDILLERTIESRLYDELGRLKKQHLGINGTAAPIDSLTYTYNIRSWLSGINKNFVESSAKSNWFGESISYDAGFTASQYNGNISGLKWKSGGDTVARAYGYTYDRAKRLTIADFTQKDGVGWARDKKDFTVDNISYDLNGNLLTLRQKGIIGATIDTIDQLSYSYVDNSNKLSAIRDLPRQKTASAGLGDFIDNVTQSGEYKYDGNGNIQSDLNKNITSVSYNFLNLPTEIKIKGKGTITYQYNALGTRIGKVIIDSTAGNVKTTKFSYDGAFVYKQDTLEFIAHEEGRIRPIYTTGAPVKYVFDYFEKDHLGNVRTVLTDQTDLSIYAATMETERDGTENALFSNVEETRTTKPAGYTADATTSNNNYVATLNAKAGGKKIGPALVLRVMAGDTVQVKARVFYKSQSPQTNGSDATKEDMLAALVQAFGQGVTTNSAHSTVAITGDNPLTRDFYNNNYQQLKDKESSASQTNRPKAYLNFLLFDDDFKMVEDNSGVRQVKATPDQLQDLSVDKMTVGKNGYLYVYTSNESLQDVNFDNVILTLNSGPLLEETHFYPFGLTMAGISSNALKGSNYPQNRLKYNSKELQSEEFKDGSGLEWYDYGARMYDPQIGRFTRIDRFAELTSNISPYHYGLNDPILNMDINGDSVVPANDVNWLKFDFHNDAIGLSEVSITPTSYQQVEAEETETDKNPLGWLKHLAYGGPVHTVLQSDELKRANYITLGTVGAVGTFVQIVNMKRISDAKAALKVMRTSKRVSELSKAMAEAGKVGKVTKVLGVASFLLSATVVIDKAVNGEDITVGDAADLVISGATTFLACASPWGIAAIALYGAVDGSGVLDGLKKELGGGTKIFNLKDYWED